MRRGATATRKRQNSKPRADHRECIRIVVYEMCDGICWVCGYDVDLTLKDPHRMSPVMDHYNDLADGGRYTKDNMLLAHKICNEIRARVGR